MTQGSLIVPHSLSQKRCELKMAQYVIRDEVCFRAVEKEGFVALVNEFEPRFQMPSRRRVADDLVSLWGEYKGVNDTVLNQRPLLECEDAGDNIGQGRLHLFDELYNGVQEEIEQDQLNQISNEVDKYLADEMEKRLYKDPTDDDLEFHREIEEIEKNQNMGQDVSQVTPPT
ncbi:hypothetical protein SASPL_152490 [Salvia splendens]|uniref:Uncharacterized protein n=1 Tax=Salvia splendens TaxID=180675 RepID=A0A8X8W3G8_SALSN|nr:hypothetical protein SASPL_152490 [Salvia splendens]